MGCSMSPKKAGYVLFLSLLQEDILCFSTRDLIAFNPGITNFSNLAGALIG